MYKISSRLRHACYDKYRSHMCSFIGWLKYCNGLNLINKVLRYKELLVYVYR